MLCRSVVRVGSVQVSITLSPLRAALISLTGLGNCNDGGNGGPGHPQLLAQISASRAATRCNLLLSLSPAVRARLREIRGCAYPRLRFLSVATSAPCCEMA